jgi:hypothetical protein
MRLGGRHPAPWLATADVIYGAIRAGFPERNAATTDDRIPRWPPVATHACPSRTPWNFDAVALRLRVRVPESTRGQDSGPLDSMDPVAL